MSMVLDTPETLSDDKPAVAGTIGAEMHDEQPAASVAQDENEFWAELELLKQIRETERERQEAANSLNELTEERKKVKEAHDGLVVRLQLLASKLIQLKDGTLSIDDLREDAEQPSAPRTECQGVTDTADPDADAWRKASTSTLLDGLKGLGKKKLEAIVDLAATAGHLEDLRAQASREHKQFKEVLPKGCGQALADGIEDRLIDHIAKFSQQPAAEQVESRNDDDEPFDSPPFEKTREFMRQLGEEQEARKAHLSMVLERVDALNTGEVDSLKDHDSEDMWEAGYEAYENGDSIGLCPIVIESDNPEIAITEAERDDWIRGWLSAELITKNDNHSDQSRADIETRETDDVLADL